MFSHNVVVTGGGSSTLLFAHGYGCDQEMWRLVTPAFVPTYRVVTFDHAGCGRRSLVPYDQRRYQSLDGYVDDLVQIITDCDVGPMVVVGHSVSAMIAVLASIRSPHLIRALALVCPSPCYLNDGDYHGGFSSADLRGLLDALDANHQTWAASMAPHIMGNAEQPALAEELEASFCRMNPLAAREFARVTFTSDNRADLVRVKVPTLIMQCSDDPIAGEAVGAYVHQQIQGSQLVKLAAAGHCPNLSSPDEVIKVLAHWLERLDE